MIGYDQCRSSFCIVLFVLLSNAIDIITVSHTSWIHFFFFDASWLVGWAIVIVIVVFCMFCMN